MNLYWTIFFSSLGGGLGGTMTAQFLVIPALQRRWQRRHHA